MAAEMPLWPFYVYQFLYRLCLKFSNINLFLIQIEPLGFAFPTEMKGIKTTPFKFSSKSLDKPVYFITIYFSRFVLMKISFSFLNTPQTFVFVAHCVPASRTRFISQAGVEDGSTTPCISTHKKQD